MNRAARPSADGPVDPVAATATATAIPSAYGIVAAEDEKGVMGDGLSQRGRREGGGALNGRRGTR